MFEAKKSEKSQIGVNGDSVTATALLETLYGDGYPVSI